MKLVLFAMLGTMMFVSKVIMEGLPNIHPLGMFIMAFTVVYRVQALIPIYVYVFLNGLFGGFGIWWVPYLYIWTILWAITMFLPKQLSLKKATVIYPLVCALHGLAFGLLYSPAQAILFGFDFQTTLRWVLAGLPFDALHAAGNLVTGMLIVPLAMLLRKLNRQAGL